MPVTNIKFQTASDGHCIDAVYAITFNVTLQGNTIQLTALAIQNIGGMVDIILWTKSLKELNSELNFSNNVLRLKNRSIFLKTGNDVTIKPGQTKVLTLYGKLPRHIIYAECMVVSSTLYGKLPRNVSYAECMLTSSTLLERIALHSPQNNWL